MILIENDHFAFAKPPLSPGSRARFSSGAGSVGIQHSPSISGFPSYLSGELRLILDLSHSSQFSKEWIRSCWRLFLRLFEST